MSHDNTYQAVMARKNEIMKSSMGLDYEVYRQGELAFDYERMMNDCGFTLEDIIRIQAETKVGNTPMFELHNLTGQGRAHFSERRGRECFWQL